VTMIYIKLYNLELSSSLNNHEDPTTDGCQAVTLQMVVVVSNIIWIKLNIPRDAVEGCAQERRHMVYIFPSALSEESTIYNTHAPASEMEVNHANQIGPPSSPPIHSDLR